MPLPVCTDYSVDNGSLTLNLGRDLGGNRDNFFQWLSLGWIWTPTIRPSAGRDKKRFVVSCTHQGKLFNPKLEYWILIKVLNYAGVLVFAKRDQVFVPKATAAICAGIVNANRKIRIPLQTDALDFKISLFHVNAMNTDAIYCSFTNDASSFAAQ